MYTFDQCDPPLTTSVQRLKPLMDSRPKKESHHRRTYPSWVKEYNPIRFRKRDGTRPIARTPNERVLSQTDINWIRIEK